MSSVTRAMLWELWRLSRYELLLRIGFQLLFPAMIVGTSLAVGTEDSPGPMQKLSEKPAIELLSSMAMIVLFISSMFSSAWLNQLNQLDSVHVGFNFRLGFTRPVSTVRLVLVPMSFLIATAVLNYILIALACNLVFKLQLPILAPALVIVCGVACMVSVVWSARGLVGRYVGLLAVIASLIGTVFLLVSSQDAYDPAVKPLITSLGDPSIFRFGWVETIALLSVSALAVAGCVASVQRQREGEPGWLADAFESLFRRRSKTDHRLTGGDSALLKNQATSAKANSVRAAMWYYWNKAGKRLMVVMVLLPLSVAILMTIIRFANSDFNNSQYLWLILIAVTPIAYQVLAAEWMQCLRHKDGITELSVFDAVQPVRGDRLIARRLLMIACFSACGWMVVVMSSLIYATVFGELATWQHLFASLLSQLSATRLPDLLLLIAATAATLVLSSAFVMGIGMALPLIKARYYFLAQAIAASLVIIGLFDVKLEWEIEWFWSAVRILAATVSIAICCGIVVSSIRRRAFGKTYAIAGLLFGTVALTGLARVATRAMALIPEHTPLQAMMVAVSVAAGVLLCIALPPLAYNLHRHR